jgi:hypothetical protein
MQIEGIAENTKSAGDQDSFKKMNGPPNGWCSQLVLADPLAIETRNQKESTPTNAFARIKRWIEFPWDAVVALVPFDSSLIPA